MRPTPPRHGPLAAAERAGSMKAPVTGGVSPWCEGWEGQHVRASEDLGCPLWVWLKMELISQPPRGAGRGGSGQRCWLCCQDEGELPDTTERTPLPA